MILDSVELTNFRSYELARFELSPAATLIVGPNASGKTNLLESLYVMAATKSFRARDSELVRHSQNFFRVVVRAQASELALGFSQDEGRQTKQVTHDGVKRALSRHVGTVPAILFEPSDMNLVTGPPDGRRRYLDFILCQTSPAYLLALNQYRRVLRQRNSLLSNFEAARIHDEIFAWDVKLAEAAEQIYRQRQDLIGYINGLAAELYGEIAGSVVQLELTYLPSIKGADYGDGFMAALSQNLPTDLAAGFTTIGPHREDFSVRFGDRPITALASRGEVRTVILVLKLAELTYSEQVLEVKPLLLLDDVFSELDQSRRRYLLAKLRGYQTIITTTEADAVSGSAETDFTVIRTSQKENSGV